MAILKVICLTLILSAFSKAQTVSIEPNVHILLVAQGSEVKLTCILENARGAFPSWSPMLSGTTESTISETVKNITGRILTIQSYNDITSTFTCTHDTLRAEIIVLPVKETKIEDHFYYGNKTTELGCYIEAKDATVEFKEWLFKNTTIGADKRFKFYNSSIIIDRPRRDDAGLYSAVFEVTLPAKEPVNYTCEVEYTAGPLVMDMARSLNLEVGDDLKISCDVKGYPKAVIFWQKDKQNITRNETIYSEYSGYKGAQITIKNMQFDDAGNYTCTAYSAEFHNSSTKHIIVRVKDPIAWVWPLIGILAEILVLAVIIFIFHLVEKRRQKKEALDNNLPVREKEE